MERCLSPGKHHISKKEVPSLNKSRWLAGDERWGNTYWLYDFSVQDTYLDTEKGCLIREHFWKQAVGII